MNAFIAPRDRTGKFVPVPRECPVCGDSLVPDGSDAYDPVWRCEGLVDPEDDNKPLAACDYVWWPKEQPNE